MKVRVLSIKEAKEELKFCNESNIKLILVSSYETDIEVIPKSNKLILHFEDTNIISINSFNKEHAQKINKFISDIDIENYKLYIC